MKIFISSQWWTYLCRVVIYSPFIGLFYIFLEENKIELMDIVIIVFLSILLKKIIGTYLNIIVFTKDFIYSPSDLNLIFKIQYRVKVSYKDIEMIEYYQSYERNERKIKILPYAIFNYLLITKKDGTKKYIEITGFTKKQLLKVEKTLINNIPNLIIKKL